jgi:[citrate (pro-3S)-lyase] ligase
MFSSLFFYPVAQTGEVLLMENRKDGIRSFLQELPAESCEGTVGAAVMNCNPFTKGHRYLIETAAKACDRLYVFVLSEDRSAFSAADRLEMVRLGTADLPNVTVLPTGPYLISSATFPTYFLKEREKASTIQCRLDIEIFTKYFVPKFGIQTRFVGTEPLSQMTNQYNEALKRYLPEAGIQLKEVERLQQGGIPVSASAVRERMAAGDREALKQLVPQTTWEYLVQHNYL